MFLWQALNPKAVVAAFAALSKEPRHQPKSAAAVEERPAATAPTLGLVNSYDPNNLT
tara:strand:- start:21353 stop:21523 length:171 start_codon:yes stop_codon:yes gene_type:complete